MKRLLIALIAAGFVSATVAMAADETPYTAKPTMEKPGRAADNSDSSVKSGADQPPKPGRAADDSGSSVKSGADQPPKAGRAADESTAGKKKNKKKKSVQPQH
jgi:hypothetical protein